MTRQLHILAIALPLSVLAGCSQQWLAKAIVEVPNTDRVDGPPPDDSAEMLARRDIDYALRVNGATPGVTLSVWIVDPPELGPESVEQPRGTIVVLHGLHDGKRRMIRLGRWLARSGYRAVLVDLRGHGASSGRWGTFGVQEGRDLSRVLDRLQAEGLLAGEVGVFGHSWGGAAALQLAAHDPRVRAVVAVATFTSMRDVVPPYVKRFAPFAGLISDAEIARAIDQAGRIAGFDPDDADSRVAAASTDAEILFVHGANDGLIPSANSRELHQCAPSNSELMIVPDANHRTVMAGPKGQDVARATVAWFDQWLRPEAQVFREPSTTFSSSTSRRAASPR